MSVTASLEKSVSLYVSISPLGLIKREGKEFVFVLFS